MLRVRRPAPPVLARDKLKSKKYAERMEEAERCHCDGGPRSLLLSITLIGTLMDEEATLRDDLHSQDLVEKNRRLSRIERRGRGQLIERSSLLKYSALYSCGGICLDALDMRLTPAATTAAATPAAPRWLGTAAAGTDDGHNADRRGMQP